MRGVNKVILVGNLGKDPEVQYLESGTCVAKFPMATTESYKDKAGNRVDQTEWHNIVLWRGLAEIAEKYLKKGSALYLEGKIKTRSWDDKDGNKKYITEIVGDNFIMLDKKGTEGSDFDGMSSSDSMSVSSPVASQEASATTTADTSDDLPF